MRHDVCQLDAELNEVSDWVEWMERELPPGGLDVPGSETCLEFASSSVRLAHGVRRVYVHLPVSLRRKLIEASLLHQCWRRQLELSKQRRSLAPKLQSLPVLEGRDFLYSANGGHKVIVASDGHQYEVRLPSPERWSALATEVTCFEIANGLGLLTPPLAIVLIDHRLAARSGVLLAHSNCAARRRGDGEGLPCLGVRRLATLKTDVHGRPSRPLSTRARTYLIGQMVLEILTANAVLLEPLFIAPNSHAEPVFNDYGHCLADSDWPRFLNEDFHPEAVRDYAVQAVRSYQQLESWISRAERLDFERICEHVVKLPAEWYGGKPLMLSQVMEKVRQRTMELRRTFLHLIDAGYFPSMRARPGQSPEVRAVLHAAVKAG